MKTNAESVMTKDPACCTPETNLRQVAQMMVDNDCGAIPVVESQENMKLVGMITDRDIVCRGVAQGKNPLELSAGDCMSAPVVTVTPETPLEECCKRMEDNQVRRIAVVDDQGRCCGVVTQAHVVRNASAKEVARLMKDVSEKTESASRVPAAAAS